MSDPLQPPNQTPLESAAGRACSMPVAPEIILTLLDPWRIPARLLPWLAWALSVDEWDDEWDEQTRRQVVADSLAVHRKKGTPWAIRQVFRSLGLGEIDIEEGRSGYRRDGSIRREPFYLRGSGTAGWAEYRIFCHKQLSIRQAETAIRMLKDAAPARCRLVEIDFSSAALIRNGLARRNGTFTRGVVNR